MKVLTYYYDIVVLIKLHDMYGKEVMQYLFLM